MTDFLPLLVLVMLLIGAVLAFRLGKRISMGTVPGGAWDAPEADPPGQRSRPWELEVVEQQVKWRSKESGAPIVTLLNQLVEASSLDNEQYHLPSYASKSQVEWVVAELERDTSMFQEGTAT